MGPRNSFLTIARPGAARLLSRSARSSEDSRGLLHDSPTSSGEPCPPPPSCARRLPRSGLARRAHRLALRLPCLPVLRRGAPNSSAAPARRARLPDYTTARPDLRSGFPPQGVTVFSCSLAPLPAGWAHPLHALAPCKGCDQRSSVTPPSSYPPSRAAPAHRLAPCLRPRFAHRRRRGRSMRRMRRV